MIDMDDVTSPQTPEPQHPGQQHHDSHDTGAAQAAAQVPPTQGSSAPYGATPSQPVQQQPTQQQPTQPVPPGAPQFAHPAQPQPMRHEWSAPTYPTSEYAAPGSRSTYSYPAQPEHTTTLPPYGSYPGATPQAGEPAAPGGTSLASPAAPRRRRRVGIAALAVAGCLAAGTAGGALGVGLADDDTPLTTNSTGSTTATQASLVDGTVQAAAATIIPSTVVISVSNNQGEGTGSGVILDTDGDILTNAHVVSGLSNATIEVTFSDGRTAPAEVVGVDASSDLAVISVSGVDDLKPAKFADSDALVIGQTVVAVGAPLGLSGTVTEGIVSAVDRPVRTGDSADASTVLDAVQTDASINPGNSGGPLVNLAGEVVGINSAIATVGASAGGEAGSIGVGFAIPSNDATSTADQLLADGTAEHASLGISASEPQSGNGALVRQVESGSAAAEAGLEQGDVITKLDDRAVLDLDSLLAAVRDHEPGDEVTVTVERDGSEQELTVTLGSREG